MQVYNFHFEQNKSAVDIAKILDVNHNTINDNIKYWKSQITNELNPQKNSFKIDKTDSEVGNTARTIIRRRRIDRKHG